MRVLRLLVAVACLAGAVQSQSEDGKNADTAILVELFTSEGCSSCPPADAWLQTLDASQPIPNAHVIVLSEHVDYWDHDGWKDPYSSSLFTDRQNGYVRALGISTAYTPQVIVNGSIELQLDKPQQLSQAFKKAASAEQIPVSIDSIGIDRSAAPILRGHIEADGTSETRNSTLYAALALDHAQSRVLHGENGGRQLTHVAVVQELIKVGKMEKGKVFSQSFQIELKPGMEPRNLRLVVFAQEPDQGNVVGAALRKIDASEK